MFNPNGETGWEDKKILYQDSPPSKPKRKYTKHAQKGALICYLHKQFFTLKISLTTNYKFSYFYIGPTLVEINDVSETNVHEEEGYFLCKKKLSI